MALFTNRAQLAYGDTITNSNVTIGEILEVLSATKTAVRTVYGQNDSVTYIVSIVNAGTVPYTGLTLTDNLGAYLFGTTTLTPLTYIDGTVRYYQNGVLQLAPTTVAGPPLVITGLTVPAGGNAIIIYEAKVNQFAPLEEMDTLTNEAVISGGGITPITVTETVSPESEPILTITKSVSPVPVTENGTLTYTFVIQNSGNTPAVATTDVVVTDDFDPILTNLTVSFNGTPWVEGVNYTYDETTGEFATITSQVTVPAATYTQDPVTGAWIIDPGVSTLVVSGII